MVQPLASRVTLLSRLKSKADSAGWGDFVRLYGPVVYGFARKQGLHDSDAVRLMQEVMRSAGQNPEMIEYDPKRLTFCRGLFAVTRSKINHFRAAQKNRPRPNGDGDLLTGSVTDGERDIQSDWDIEYQRRFVVKAMNRVKHEFPTSIWQAFWKTAVNRQPAAEAGLEFNMSAGAVYIAKSRVLARLHEEVYRLQAEAEAWCQPVRSGTAGMSAT